MRELKLKIFLIAFVLSTLSNVINATSVRVVINNISYTVDDEAMTAEVSGPVSSSMTITNLVIPNYIEYEGSLFPVTSIQSDAFYNNRNLTGSLNIGDNVKTIGAQAFYYCSGFTGTLTIGQNVETIGDRAFLYCTGFTGTLNIPNSVQTIGTGAFEECKGFTGSLTIGENVQTIGPLAFLECKGFTGSLTIPNSVQTIGPYAFWCCSGLTGSLTIPHKVQTIGKSAFYGCFGFTGSLTIGENVQTIEESAFYKCSGFTGSLIIPTSVQTIGESAFYNCSGFTGSLTLGDNVQTIGEYAFQGCSGFTGSLTIGQNVETIGKWAFSKCSGFTGSLTIPNSVQTIGEYAFDGCSGFTGSLTIGENVQTIGRYAFSSCSGFTGSLTIGNNVQTIGNWAFDGCSGFTSLFLPVSINEYDSGLFYKMPLKEIKCMADNPPTIQFTTFSYNTSKTACLYVPLQSVSKYKSATYWKDFNCINNIKVLPTSLTVKPTETTLRIGDIFELEISILPEEAEDADLTLTSSNIKVATVDDDGIITALSEGKTTIIVETENGLSASCEVTVVPVRAESITLSVENLTLLVGQTDKLTATVEPANTTDKTVSWSTDNNDVISVETDGTVTALTAGTANVTATCGDATATCGVTVISTEDGGVTVKPGDGTSEGDEDDTPGNNTENGGSLIGSDLTLRVNQTATIELSLPENLSVTPTFSWTLDNGGAEIVGMTVNGNTLSATFRGLKVGQTGYTVSLNGAEGNIEAVKGKIIVIAERPISSLELDPASITMAQNALPQTIKPVYTPENASMPEFNWSSSVPTVATVSQDGFVTPIGQGETIITATALDGSGLSATSKVTVTEPIDENFEFEFDESVMGGKEGISLYIGETYTFTPKAQEGYVLPDVINWTSSDAETVSVDSNGKITALKLGKATVTASATVNGKEVKATCEVTVIPIMATDIKLSANNLTLLVGQKDILKATVEPANTTDKTVSWSTDNNEVISMDSDGTVTTLSAGTANVTATCGDATATCIVTVISTEDGGVTVKPGDGTTEGDEDDTPGDNTENGGSLICSDLTLRVNQTATIELSLPENLSVTPTFSWTLDNGGTEIVGMTVNDNTLSATFRGLKVGQTGYTVSLNGTEGNIEAVRGKITVIAERPISSLELDPASITMAKNALPQTIKPVYTPENASMPQFNWTSSVPTVATVDQEGKVTPVGQGETVITATAKDGSGLSATSKVTVTEPIDENFEFEFDESVMGGKEGISLYIGETYTFTPKAQEGYVLPEVINWSSSDAETVNVDSNGKITALKLGKATVTASATVNGKEVKATCEVTVIPITATDIKLSANNLTLLVGQKDVLTATVEPANTTDKTVSWSTENNDVISVGSDGTVTALSAGTASVTATCGDATATCVVTVISTEDGGVTVKPGDGTTEGDEDDTPGNNTENGGSLIGSDLTLRVNQTATIELSLPENLSVTPTFSWILDNGGAEFVGMTVNGNTLSAIFRGLKVGQTGYTVSLNGAEGNMEAVRGKITVIAERPISSLELDPTAITMAENALPQTIKPVYTPENATMPEFNWTSSVPTVATVSQDGVVTPVGQGETVITATALDGSGLSATSKVTVTEPIDENFEFEFDESVMGGKEGISLYIGETYTFTPKAQEGYVLPDVINWSSSDAATVSVDSNGKITALKLGKATVTASATVNGKEVKATCEVTVIPILATSISISGNDIHTLKQTETLQLTVTVNPGNTTNQEIIWTSSDEGKATVSNSGLVTAVEEGSVEITAALVYQPEITTSYSITIQKRLLGDANDNGVVNIADVGTISDYIVEKPVYEFCFVNADVVTDNKITTADVTATLDIIFNDVPVMAKAAKAYRNVSQSKGNLFIDDFKPSVFGNSTVGISLAENSDLVGLQATMIIPEGMTVENVKKGNGASDHILNYYITDHGTLNFILYSLNNSTFETKNGPLVEITVAANEDCENILMNNILASDAFANEYSLSFSGGENKGIITSVSDLNSSEIEIASAAESVIVTNARGEVIRIFAPSGELIKWETATSDNETFVLTPGIYIVTVKEKTAKLIIK